VAIIPLLGSFKSNDDTFVRPTRRAMLFQRNLLTGQVIEAIAISQPFQHQKNFFPLCNTALTTVAAQVTSFIGRKFNFREKYIR